MSKHTTTEEESEILLLLANARAKLLADDTMKLADVEVVLKAIRKSYDYIYVGESKEAREKPDKAEAIARYVWGSLHLSHHSLSEGHNKEHEQALKNLKEAFENE